MDGRVTSMDGRVTSMDERENLSQMREGWGRGQLRRIPLAEPKIAAESQTGSPLGLSPLLSNLDSLELTKWPLAPRRAWAAMTLGALPLNYQAILSFGKVL